MAIDRIGVSAEGMDERKTGLLKRKAIAIVVGERRKDYVEVGKVGWFCGKKRRTGSELLNAPLALE